MIVALVLVGVVVVGAFFFGIALGYASAQQRMIGIVIPASAKLYSDSLNAGTTAMKERMIAETEELKKRQRNATEELAKQFRISVNGGQEPPKTAESVKATAKVIDFPGPNSQPA